MGTSRRAMGVYQPRNRKAAFADAMADARRTLMNAVNIVILRGAGALLFVGSVAALLALATYNSADASMNTATGAAPTNLLGGFGATGADLLLQTFGIAALAFLAPPAFWGVKALTGKHLKHAIWRAFAWPLGTLFVAAGLGIVTGPQTLPTTGCGGLIGVAVKGLSAHVAQVYDMSWLANGLPLMLLIVGLPLAFVATGIHVRKTLHNLANVPAFFLWAHEKTSAAISEYRDSRPRAYDHDHGDDDHEYDDEDEDGDGYELKLPPEPIAARSEDAGTARKVAVRLKREEQKKAAPLKPAKQPALNLAHSESQLPALGLLAEPVRVTDNADISDEALEENARMLEAGLA